jgi:hypothetical protein
VAAATVALKRGTRRGKREGRGLVQWHPHRGRGGGVGDRHAVRKEGEGVRRRQDVPTGEAGGGRCGAAA